ncbi:MAG: Crp/Fnr family transcriptional regulator [Acidobacteria bacterium]|nr:Crp/Fnr family transcriptional regulator [Acidobacteriota bacterium]
MLRHRKLALLSENRILASLPDSDYQRLLPDLKPVSLQLGDILYAADETIRYVYFPIKSVVSFIWNTANDSTIEVGMVGSEGMTGICIIAGIKTLPYQSVVQGADGAMKIKTTALMTEFNRHGALHHLLLQYMHGLFIQVARTAVCNRIHPIQERFCRWLLMIRDRTSSDELYLTHEFIASMLGARRSDVTLAAGLLQKAGLIRYSRGHVSVLDSQRLMATACDCYRISKAEFNRIGLGY